MDILDILDAREIDLQPLPYRRLKCIIPKRVNSYCEEIRKKWDNHKIKEKIDKLEDMSTLIDDPNLFQAFTKYLNQYDAEIGGILSSAERNCCQVGRRCSLLFTPTLHKLLRNKRQLQQQISKRKKLSAHDESPMPLDELKSLQKDLKSINSNLREYSETQREKRDEEPRILE